MPRKPKFKPVITRVKLNPEQAVLSCTCFNGFRVVWIGGDARMQGFPAGTYACIVAGRGVQNVCFLGAPGIGTSSYHGVPGVSASS